MQMTIKFNSKQAAWRYRVLSDTARSAAKGLYFHFEMQISRFRYARRDELYRQSPLSYQALKFRWRVFGLYFGYNSCCVQAFIRHDVDPESYPKPDGPWIGTGFIPCEPCGQRALDTYGHAWRHAFFKHRQSETAFPKCERDFARLRFNAVNHWMVKNPFWHRMAELSVSHMTNPIHPVLDAILKANARRGTGATRAVRSRVWDTVTIEQSDHAPSLVRKRAYPVYQVSVDMMGRQPALQVGQDIVLNMKQATRPVITFEDNNGFMVDYDTHLKANAVTPDQFFEGLTHAGETAHLFKHPSNAKFSLCVEFRKTITPEKKNIPAIKVMVDNAPFYIPLYFLIGIVKGKASLKKP